MIRTPIVVFIGSIVVLVSVITLLFGQQFIIPFYELLGSTASVGGTTANQAVPAGRALLFGGMAVIAVGGGIALYLFLGGNSLRPGRRPRQPPRGRV